MHFNIKLLNTRDEDQVEVHNVFDSQFKRKIFFYYNFL